MESFFGIFEVNLLILGDICKYFVTPFDYPFPSILFST